MLALRALIRGSRSSSSLDFSIRERPHVDYGYAVTSHSSQGATADRVLVHVHTEQAREELFNSGLAYVSVSRGRYDAPAYIHLAVARAPSRIEPNGTVVACFTARAESVRIFSVRTATARERKDYEENIPQ